MPAVPTPSVLLIYRRSQQDTARGGATGCAWAGMDIGLDGLAEQVQIHPAQALQRPDALIDAAVQAGGIHCGLCKRDAPCDALSLTEQGAQFPRAVSSPTSVLKPSPPNIDAANLAGPLVMGEKFSQATLGLRRDDCAAVASHVTHCFDATPAKGRPRHSSPSAPPATKAA